MVNKYQLLREKPNNNHFGIIVLLLIIVLIIFGYLYESYDIYKTEGINECSENICYLKLILPYDKTNLINDRTILKVNDDEVDINEIEYGSYETVNNIIYQTVNLKTDLDDNKVYRIKLLNNKKRIIKRIIDMMKG